MENIIFISLAAVVCGASSWNDIELFAKTRKQWLSSFLDMSGGVPSHDTLNRFFSGMNPQYLEECFRDWVASIIERAKADDQQLQVISIDGKTIRGLRTFEESPIHMVSAWSSTYQLSLGQVATEEKSNEITAIPELLDVVAIDGSVVTIDAMGCQRDIAQKILRRGGDYVLAVKGNQGLLLDGIEDSFRMLPPVDSANMNDFGHGRIEHRTCLVTNDLSLVEGSENWPGLQTIVQVSSEREFKKTGKTETSTRYYISSLPANAEIIGKIVRQHWSIENNLHWSMDVSFNEDLDKKRDRNAVVNFSLLNKIALTLLKQDTSSKVGIKSRRKQAGWSPDYLLSLFEGI